MHKTKLLLILFLFTSSFLHAQQNKLFSEAYSLMQKSLFGEAVVKLKESLKENPNHAPTNSNLALCLEKLKKYDEAVQVWRRYERISKTPGGKIQQHIMLIGKMKEILPNLTKGNPTSVMGTISQILKDPYPESIIKLDCATSLAHYYYIKNKYSESYSLYSQAISQYRNYFVDEEALYEYANLLLKEKKKYLEAAKIYKDILIRPKRKKADVTDLLAECYKNKAEDYEKEGKEKPARLMYERILIETPSSKYAEVAKSKVGDIVKSVDKIKERADILYEAGKYNEALPLYKDLRTESTDLDIIQYAMFQTAQCISTQRKYKEAIKLFHEAIRKYPKGEYADDALFRAACLLGGLMKKYDLALKEWGLLLSKYPNSEYADEAYFDIGRIYKSNLKDKRKAYQAFTRLIKKCPDSPWVPLAKHEIAEMKK